MSNSLNRAFKVSDGLAHLVGKKIKAAVNELQKEGIITKQEGQKAISRLSKVKRTVYDSVSRELKKIVVKKRK